jgi:hypothetical protein
MELKQAMAMVISFSLFFLTSGYILGYIHGGKRAREIAEVWEEASGEWSKQCDRWKEMYFDLKWHHGKIVEELNKLLEERGFIKENQDPG